MTITLSYLACKPAGPQSTQQILSDVVCVSKVEREYGKEGPVSRITGVSWSIRNFLNPTDASPGPEACKFENIVSFHYENMIQVPRTLLISQKTTGKCYSMSQNTTGKRLFYVDNTVNRVRIPYHSYRSFPSGTGSVPLSHSMMSNCVLLYQFPRTSYWGNKNC